MSMTLRILMYKEADDFSAVCLEPYLVVRGDGEADVRKRTVALFDNYAKNGRQTLQALGRAPASYFVDWVETDGDPKPIEVEIPTLHRQVATEVKEYQEQRHNLDVIFA